MYIQRKHSSTSNVLRVVLRNSSTGQGLTGLTYSSSGLVISTVCDVEAVATTYTAAGSTIESITTLGTYEAPSSGKCRFKEVDATNHPGLYELQLADARFAVTNAKELRITISGATNLIVKDVVIQLADVSADVVKVSGDSTAADNLEAILDGTGAQLTLSSAQIRTMTIGSASESGTVLAIVSTGEDAAPVLIRHEEVTGTTYPVVQYLAKTGIPAVRLGATGAGQWHGVIDGNLTGSIGSLPVGTGTGQIYLSGGRVDVGKWAGNLVYAHGYGPIPAGALAWGQFASGSTTTELKLGSNASNSDDDYVGAVIICGYFNPTSENRPVAGVVTGYDGNTHTATLSAALPRAPAMDEYYVIMPDVMATESIAVSTIADAVCDELVSEHTLVGSVADYLRLSIDQRRIVLP